MLTYLRRYPALSAGVVLTALPIAKHFLPGVAVDQIGDFLLAGLALLVGAEVHRRVAPVPSEDRGLKGKP